MKSQPHDSSCRNPKQNKSRQPEDVQKKIRIATQFRLSQKCKVGSTLKKKKTTNTAVPPFSMTCCSWFQLPTINHGPEARLSKTTSWCLCHSPHFISPHRHLTISYHHREKGEYSVISYFGRERERERPHTHDFY